MLPNSLVGRPHARMPAGMNTPINPLNRPCLQTQIPNQARPAINIAHNPAQFVPMQFGANITTNSTVPVAQFASQTPSAMIPILPKFATAPPTMPSRHHTQSQAQAHAHAPSGSQQQPVQPQPQQVHTFLQGPSTLHPPQQQQQQHFQQPMLTNQQAAAFQQALSAAAAAIGSDPTSQFAAGFAAAAALSNPTFQRAFNQAFAQSTSAPSNDSDIGPTSTTTTFGTSQNRF